MASKVFKRLRSLCYFYVISAVVLVMSTLFYGTNVHANKQSDLVYHAITQVNEWLNTSRALTVEDLQGRIILLDFWTYCCINCIHVVPDLHYLEKKYGNKLTVIGVHSAKFFNERDTDNIRAAIARYDIEHPVINDKAFRVWQSFGIRAWPSFALINPEGGIETIISGENNRDELDERIGELIAEYADSLVADPLPLAIEEIPPSILEFPGKLAYDHDRKHLIISDSNHHRILIIDHAGTILETIGSGEAGLVDGNFDQAQFLYPQGVLYRDGILYVADTGNHVLRKIDLTTKQVTRIAGTGKKGQKRFAINTNALTTPIASPWDLAFFPTANDITIAMAGTHQLWRYDIEQETLSVYAGNGRESIDDGKYPFNSLSQPSGLAVHDELLYFVDSETSALRSLTPEGEITTLIGEGLFEFGLEDGAQGIAKMQHPLGVFANDDGVYITDTYNHAIRKYHPDTKQLSTIAGNGDRGYQDNINEIAMFNEPNDLLLVGDKWYIADTNNHAIRTMSIVNGIATIASLAVTPHAESDAGSNTFQAALPNTITLEQDILAGNQSMPWSLILPKGWKVNEEAPSWLHLYRLSGEEYSSVASWNVSDIISKNVIVSALQPGQYHIQGTLYVCEDWVGALCYIKSVQQPLQVTSTNGKSALNWDFRNITLP